MENNKRTQAKWEIHGELDNLSIEVIQNKDTDEEYSRRIASVIGYDYHIPRYEENKANAEFICEAANNYDKLKENNALLIETLKKVKDDYLWNKYIEGMQVINNDTGVREVLGTTLLLNEIKEVLRKVENK